MWWESENEAMNFWPVLLSTSKMDQEAVEYILFLKQNASELRKLGSDWGMTHEEINDCINKVLSQEKNASEIQKNSTKNWARTIWSYILFMVKIPVYTVLIIFSLICLLFVATSIHEPTDNFISKAMQPHGYEIFRLLRLVTLPVHRIANITSMHTFVL